MMVANQWNDLLVRFIGGCVSYQSPSKALREINLTSDSCIGPMNFSLTALKMAIKHMKE